MSAAHLITRRNLLASALFGVGGVGLRALATGLPVSFLLNPRRALAGGGPSPCSTSSKAQYVLFSTSGDGDSINACVPGTYEDPRIVHSTDPGLAPKPLVLRGRTYTAAAPWAALPQSVLDRTVFWHLMTTTPVHADEAQVLRLMGATQAREMLPSLLAKHLAPCLGTIQPQPISLGAATPSEALSYGGAAQPVIPPLALQATLTKPAGPLADLSSLRDETLADLYDLYKNSASPRGRAYLDSLVTSREQARSIRQDLLNTLSSIQDNGPAAQVLAAITLIQMNVSPVIVVHIPFGGDNHADPGLVVESAQTSSALSTISNMMRSLTAAGLQDKVTFMTLNVFGRTLGPGNTDGRSHNPNHQVSVTIGKPFLGGVVGAVGPVGSDYGALAIDSKTGAGTATGDVRPVDTLAAFGQTMLASVGGDPTVIVSPGGTSSVLASALAPR